MPASWSPGKCEVFPPTDGVGSTTMIKRGSDKRALSNPGANEGETPEGIFICDLGTSERMLCSLIELETGTAQEGA